MKVKVCIHRKKKVNKKFAYTPNIQIYNKIWEFYKYDKDPFPCVLHGHSDKNLKLNANTGEVFDKAGRYIGKVKSKELNRLHSNKVFRKFAIERLEWYKSEFPNIPVESLEWLHSSVSVNFSETWKNKSPDRIFIRLKGE